MPRTRSERIDSIDWLHAREEYEHGKSSVALAKELNVADATVRHELRMVGTKLRRRGRISTRLMMSDPKLAGLMNPAVSSKLVG